MGHPNFDRFLFAPAIVLAGVAASPAHAQLRSFDIAAQSAVKSIPELARQADIQILVSEVMVRGKTTPAVRGTMPTVRAIEQMLHGSGLIATTRDRHTYVLLPAAARKPSVMARADPLPQNVIAAAPSRSDVAPVEDVAGEGIGDIVVTAQKREESVQRVPIAITAIQGQTLQTSGIRSAVNLEQAVAGVRIVHKTGGGDEGHAYLRGLGFSSGSPGIDLPVAFYIDDVYVPDPVGGSPAFNSIEQVEVLKGPQGTLFGRNAVGGVVNVRTRDPKAETAANFDLGYGNYDSLSAAGYLTGGLAPGVSANLALAYRHQQRGFGYNYTLGRRWRKTEAFSARGKIKFELDEATDVLLTGWYGKASGDASSYTIVPGTTAIGSFKSPPGTGFFDGYSAYQPAPVEMAGSNLRFEHEFGSFRLVDIASFAWYSPGYAVDLDLTAVPVSYFNQRWHSNNYQNEIQLTSLPDQPVQWVAGLYAFRQSLHETTVISGNAVPAGQIITARLVTKALAPFGQAIIPVFDNTNLTLGLRYNIDRRELDSVVSNRAGVRLVAAAPEQSFRKLTYRVALDHQFTPDILGYVSYSRGYKPGTYNPGGNPTRQVLRSEILDDLEGGIKSRFLQDRLQVNLAVFHYVYKNTTLRGFLPGANSIDFFNGSDAKIYGGEIETVVKPARGLTLSAGLSYLHGRYGDYRNAVSYTPSPIPPGGNTAVVPFDATGNFLANSPTVSGNANITYTFSPSPEFGDVTASVNAYATSRVYFEPNNVLSQAGYALLNTTLAWKSADGGFGVTLWAHNLTNKHYFGEASVTGLSTAFIPGEPRTFGITLHKNFE